MKHHEHREPAGDGADAELESLLQSAGPRSQPSADVAAEVRAAVAAEWRKTVAAQRMTRRRAVTPWLAAASVAVVAAGVWLVAPRLRQFTADFMTVARLTGPVEVRRDGDGAWRSLDAVAALHTGDVVRTSGAGRVALRRADGFEMRLDSDTTVSFDGLDVAALDSGRVYVDAGRAGSRAAGFEVQTSRGGLHHLGTQYSVALTTEALTVAVREGSVALDGDRADVVARAGERLTVQADGRVVRDTIATHGEDWEWVQAVAPSFAIEGHTLDEFLAWAARETGHQLVYASTDAARLADSTVLRGSVEDLTPEQAIAAVLTTTPSLQHRFAGRQLRIERASP